MEKSRKETIEQQIDTLYQLLSEYEENNITEADPKRKRKNNSEIESLKKQISEKKDMLSEVKGKLNSNQEKTLNHYKKRYANFDKEQAENELKKVNAEIAELKNVTSDTKGKKKLAFLTADPKNTNPVKALHQKQDIEDIFQNKMIIKDNTRTKYNELAQATKDCSLVHITVHCKNDELFFEHDKKEDAESSVNAEYFCYQLKKNKDIKDLIVLVACRSANFAKQIVKEGIAKIAIGTNIDISAGAAVEFTAQFYKELSSENDIKTAFENTLIELKNNPKRELNDEQEKYNYSEIFVIFEM